jgi:hypothetical protein
LPFRAADEPDSPAAAENQPHRDFEGRKLTSAPAARLYAAGSGKSLRLMLVSRCPPRPRFNADGDALFPSFFIQH